MDSQSASSTRVPSFVQVVHLSDSCKGRDNAFLQTTVPFREAHKLEDPEEILESMSQANGAFKTGCGPTRR